MPFKPSKLSPYQINDPLFSQQWFLTSPGGWDMNVTRVWNSYTGTGIRVGIYDDGVMGTHPDLQANFDAASKNLETPADGVFNPPTVSGGHGTPVAGMVAAANNGSGGVGVAWGAKVVAYVAPQSGAGFAAACQTVLADGVHVLNNSWGPMQSPFDAQAEQAAYWRGIDLLATHGRGGLGTVVVFAGGNDREVGFNTNWDPTNNAPNAIQVASYAENGAVSDFSTPGANLLVAAPGTQVRTTDAAAGYSPTDGTSFAAPAVSAVVALMLQANPLLGYRDVQEILAYSARVINPAGGGWQANRATDWNGGAHLVSTDYGYGAVDALAAVRLAESWTKQSTTANMATETAAGQSFTVAGGGSGTAPVTLARDIRVQNVTVTVDLSCADLSKVKLVLVSPTGTESVLADHPPAWSRPDQTPTALPTELSYSFGTTRDWGESGRGIWRLKVESDGPQVAIRSWSLTDQGDAMPTAKTYIYTNDYATLSGADATRAILNAGTGATINAAAVTGDCVIDLTGQGGSINGAAFTLGSGTVARVHTGDGKDTLTGSTANDTLLAGAGDDRIVRSGGTDLVYGQQGFDTFVCSGSRASYTLSGNSATRTLTGANGTTTLHDVEAIQFADGTVFDMTAGESGYGRLYTAALNRRPDLPGMSYYLDRMSQGLTLEQAATGFINSPEFTTLYPDLDPRGYVSLLYRNVLSRAATEAEVDYHAARLGGGATREQVLLGFSEAPEYVRLTSDFIWIG